MPAAFYFVACAQKLHIGNSCRAPLQLSGLVLIYDQGNNVSEASTGIQKVLAGGPVISNAAKTCSAAAL